MYCILINGPTTVWFQLPGTFFCAYIHAARNRISGTVRPQKTRKQQRTTVQALLGRISGCYLPRYLGALPSYQSPPPTLSNFLSRFAPKSDFFQDHRFGSETPFLRATISICDRHPRTPSLFGYSPPLQVIVAFVGLKKWGVRRDRSMKIFSSSHL